MRKSFILLLLIIITGVFIADCVMDSIHYCPYCGYNNVKEIGDGIYKCGRSGCGRTFGAKVIKE